MLHDLILTRLQEFGIKHIMTVAGDFTLNLLDEIGKNHYIKYVNTADEAGAAFAADGYARVNGYSCVLATYNVGALKLVNAIAGAYAEHAPIVVISGAPGVQERNSKFTPHHFCNAFNLQEEIFKKITCAQAIIKDHWTTREQIDHAFNCMRRYKQPIYIEIPRDMVNVHIIPSLMASKLPLSDNESLEDALQETIDWINSSKNPVILAGVQLARYGLGDELIKFAEKYNIPIASTVLSKSIVNETHPCYAGVYSGKNSQPNVKELVEGSDCLLMLGEVLTEATIGYTLYEAFQKRQMITCLIDGLKIKNHTYQDVLFKDFCNELFKADLKIRNKQTFVKISNLYTPTNAKLTNVRLFEKINSILNENFVVISDVGDALLGAADLITTQINNSFLGPAYYLSMGYAIPAALGVKLAKDCRPIVIVGDGSFQMSSAEIGVMSKLGQNPIIFVMNNRGYTTERLMLDGPFNDIPDWKYEKICDVMGGQGFKVENELELELAVEKALQYDNVSVINCMLDPFDGSPVLRRMTASFSEKIANCKG